MVEALFGVLDSEARDMDLSEADVIHIVVNLNLRVIDQLTADEISDEHIDILADKFFDVFAEFKRIHNDQRSPRS